MSRKYLYKKKDKLQSELDDLNHIIEYLEARINHICITCGSSSMGLIANCAKLSEYISYRDSKVVKINMIKNKIRLMERKDVG